MLFSDLLEHSKHHTGRKTLSAGLQAKVRQFH